MKSPRSKITVKVARLPHGDGLPLPAYQTEYAAGLDLLAANAADAPVTIAPGKHALVPTGLTFELPPGTEAQVRPRSGLAAKFAVTVLNSPGTIDADYRGEVQVILINHGAQPFTINRGDRIAQMVIASLVHASFAETKAPLSPTKRGKGGFGSTGISRNGEKKKRIAREAPKAKSPKRKTASAKKA
jgi:dUTP pyrophosphatase